ncbi:hypothetical protein WK92_24520 [Burkholderia ubonensis]|uniref:UPF0489 family protein n=1 Tax=Burkholderia ubonensis TaxID=101571 RepID=UPI00075870B5|nr:UPF0489 family protein [Burkholderia ubonensis]KVV46722.1 hypothetical protein WK82_15190 [Burkholderia ubonensis]KVW13734.1 hypothetical protein WK92_24520 [Burkholderia ubonensis]
MAHKKVTIGGKDVYIVKDHHHVLGGWAEVRLSQEEAGAPVPALLTLDHHTDTRPPFDNHRFWATHSSATQPRNTAAMNAMLSNLLGDLTWRTKASVKRAIDKLKHDEHIRTAIEANIVSRAFVINLDGGNGVGGDVYETYSGCVAIGCTKPIHDSDCERARADQVLETVYLDHELGKLNAMAQANGVPGVEAEPYILDIDLDYFHTEKAIEPDDPATFYRLVQNASAVTIATEPGCVRNLRLTGSKITGKSLLASMLQQIETALS